MTDIAAVLDAAATAVAGVGKADVKAAAGQAGKHATSFFAVLVARIGDQDTIGMPVGDDIEALVSNKGGEAASVKGDATLLPADAAMLPPQTVVDASATVAVPFHQSLSGGDAALPEGVNGRLDNPENVALTLATPLGAGAIPMSGDGRTDAWAGLSGGASGGRTAGAQAGASGLRDADGVARPANSAAGSVSRGQLLPSATLARAGEDQPGLLPAELMKDGAGDGAAPVTPNTLSMAASNAVGNVATDISAAQPFEHVMRQAENRLHLSVDTPVRSPAFATELGEKVVWLAGRQGQVAELSLNPPQMGAVEVRLSLSGGEAGAQFFSASPAVREAIEAALPKLRELMAQAGINLGEAQVRDEAFMQDRSSGAPGREGVAVAPREAGVASEPGAGAVRTRGIGLVDLYV
jgi:flagellar hook-length control protein FliK